MSYMREDLALSGLVAGDLDAREIGSPERAVTNVPYNTNGYVLPYFKMDGSPLGHYRVRLFDHDIKYKQPKDSSNYVYFPKGLHHLLSKPYIIITEGEKKAARCVKAGHPCIAFSGVDSWRNRSIILPGDTELNQTDKKISAKIPQGQNIEETMSSLAIGMQELIDHILQTGKHVIIVYDSDKGAGGVKPSVQRAAATLAFELRFQGIAFNRIRQAVIPTLNQEKMGLDDFLETERGPDLFSKLISDTIKLPSAFPIYPAIREYIGRKLQRARLTRKEVQQVAMAILSDLDANGHRLRSDQELQTYYFDQGQNKLLKAEFNRKGDFHDTRFGQHLYRRYGISAGDSSVTDWLASQFTGEDPVGNVSPHRVIARVKPNEDSVILQLSDSHYAKVTASGLTIHANGSAGILFESEQVEPLDANTLVQEFERQKSNQEGKPLKSYWLETLQSVRLKDQNDQRFITALLYYISPWLYRWRGMQLPVEMIIGESGSGKSTLYELRLHTMTGDAKLRNAPQDLKDWHASIANTGGLHVTDNVQLVDRNLRQRLSDEICRIITEPTPSIEMRKYYTNADLVRIPVRSVFAITAIQQPFQNADLIQRSIITELDKMGSTPVNGQPVEIRYDSEWRNIQLAKYNGREGWIAHHLLALHRFFQLVQSKWQKDYQAHHRLINFEQSMMIMAQVFGLPHEWIPTYLSNIMDKALSESDWTFEGLKAFVDVNRPFFKNRPVTAQQIADWATTQEDYNKCEMLINTRKLGRYLNQHKTMVASIIGLVDAGKQANRQVYRITEAVKSASA